jgi:hypothetical protein
MPELFSSYGNELLSLNQYNQLIKHFCYYKFSTQSSKNLRKNAQESRTNYLHDLASAKAISTGKTHAHMIQEIKQREHIQAVFRKIKYASATTRVGLTQVETSASSESGTTITHTSKEMIEQACMNENIRRFTQAYHTPSLQSDQIALLGWTGNSISSTEILNGTVQQFDNQDDLHPGIRRLSPFLSVTPTIQELGSIATTLSREEFRWHWKRCREYTSCGRSRMHFGHFKASSAFR